LRNSTNANTVTIQSAVQSGNYTLSIPNLTSNADICTSLNNCAVAPGSGNYIQNQNSAAQTSSNFWIDGTGRANTSLLTPLVDTATATALNLGTTNASSISIGKAGVTTTVQGNLQGNGNLTIKNPSNFSLLNVNTGANTVSLGQTTVDSGVTFGNTSGSMGYTSFSGGYVTATRYQTSATAGLTSKITARITDPLSAPNNKFRLAIYADNAGSPGALIAQTGEGTIGPMYTTLAINATLSSSTYYWLAYITNGADANFNDITYSDATGGTSCYTSNTYTNGFPASLSGATCGGTQQYIIYVTFAASTSTAMTIDSAGNVGIGTTGPSHKLEVAGDALFRNATDSETALQIQNASGSNILTVDTANNQLVVGNDTVAGKISLSDGASRSVTITAAAQTGNYTLSIPILANNDTICTVGLNNCGGVAGANTSLSNLTTTNINQPLNRTAGNLTLQTTTSGNINISPVGTINLNQNTVLAAGKSITISGGNTASRPASPTEGMLYYDTDTHQLLVYNNSKWKASGSEAILVAASDSSAADKAAADYLADGNTAAANDGDQIQINAALTAGAGKKVLLLAGTYTIDAGISVPNNTTLAGAGSGTVITIPNSFNTNINAITNTTTGGNGTGVTIQDLRLEGNKANQSSGSMYGIYFNGVGSGSGSSAIAGGKITNVAVNNWRSTGIYLSSSSNNILTGNILQKNTSYGIYLFSSSNNNTITGTIVQGGLYGIDLDSSSNNILTGNTVQGCGFGFYLSSSSNNTLTANMALGNNSGIYLDSSSNNTITGNTTRSNNVWGISINSSNDNTITGNTVQGDINYAIYLSYSSNNTVGSNNLYDNGDTTDNNALYLTASSNNTITGNTITDSSATTTNYAINISDSTSSANYLADNTLGGGSINNAGTGTIYGGQLDASNNYIIQPAGNINLQKNTNITGTITGTSSLTLGTSSSTNGTIVLENSTNANTVTIQSAAQTSGSYTLSVPLLTANADICTSLGNCSTAAGSNYYIQNQNSAAQTTSNFWISGTGRANTSFLAPAFDVASAGTLALGNATATTINIAANNTAHTINIGTSATTNQTVNIGSKSGTSTTTISAGSGGLVLDLQQAMTVYSGGVQKMGLNTSTTSLSNQIISLNDSSGSAFIGMDEGTSNVTVAWNRTLDVAGGAEFENGFTVWSTTTSQTYTSPLGASLQAKISLSNQTLGSFSSIIAGGISSSSDATARGILIADARTVAHQATIGILSPDENDIFGISWDGDNKKAIIKTGGSGSSISLKPGNHTALRAFDTYNIRIGNTTDENPADPGARLLIMDDVAPSAAAGNGTNATNSFVVYGQTGGATTSSGYTAGTGSGVYIQGGQGGNAVSGSTNGTGGNVTLSAGAAGAGAGAAGQAGSVIIKNQSNSTTAFQVQNTGGNSLFAVDTTNSRVVLGNSTTAGKINLSDGASRSVTITAATQAGSYTLTIPALSGNSTICTDNSATACGSFIQNTTSLQSSSSFYISGTGRAATSILTPLVDTISAAALNIGTTNATSINLNQNTTVAAGKTFAMNGGGSVTTTNTSAFVIQDASSNVLFTADTSAMQIVFGNTTNGVIVSAGGIQLKGTARNTKNILLTPEYSGAVLDALSDSACVSNYTGTMTSAYDAATRMNYYNWQSSSGTAQCFDVVVQVPIPSDFDSWSGTPNIQLKSDATGTAAYALQIVPSSGTDANYSSYVSPGTIGTSWANMATSSLSGTYTAGDYLTIKVRLSSTSGANVQLGNIKLTYKSKF
jgi:parallel beta-helix repeat protein